MAAEVDRHHCQPTQQSRQGKKCARAEGQNLHWVGLVDLEIGHCVPQPRGDQPDQQRVEPRVVDVVAVDAMARAFALGIEAGRLAYEADPMEPRDMAAPSTPLIGQAVLG